MSGHALLSPSASARWLNCPASVQAIKNLEETGQIEYNSSAAADEGTTAHALAEVYLNPLMWEVPVSESLGEVCEETGIAFDEQMCEHIETYRSYVKDYIDDNDEFGEDLHIEVRLPLFYSPEDGGTSDVCLYEQSTKTLHVIDLKYGMNVVEATDNTQLIIYGESARQHFKDEYDIEKIRCHIVQPRRNHFDDFTYTLSDLKSWRATIEAVARRINSGTAYENQEFKATEKGCHWCPLKGDCKAQADQLIDELTFDEVLMPNHDLLSLNDLAGILEKKSAIEEWLKSVHAIARTKIETGTDIPGYKLVATEKNRAWIDEEAAEKLLSQKLKKDERFTSKLLSPTQAVTALKKQKLSSRYENLLNDLIHRPEGEPALVPESDKREAINFKSDIDELAEMNEIEEFFS
jgi:hypothetical protein